MDIRCLDYDELSLLTAMFIEAQLAEKPESNFGLAWGSSPIGVYQLLGERCRAGKNSFRHAKVFAGDEYIGSSVGQDLLERTLYRNIDLPLFSRFNPTQCDQYDRLIEDLGGLDFLLLGFGRNGHLMACEPGTPWTRRTHIAKLASETNEDNKAKYGESYCFARTIGPATIMSAKRIVLLISGEHKREAAIKALFGPVSTSVTASILQLHRNATVLCDFSLPNPLSREHLLFEQE